MEEQNRSTEETVVEQNAPETQADAQPEKETKAEKPEKPVSQEDVQKLMNDLARTRRALDKASAEASDFKKKYKESLSEVEQANMEKAEREAAREEEFKALKREVEINRLEKTYLAMGWTADEASRMATAEADGDMDAKLKVMTEAQERQKKDLEKNILASYGNVNVGASGSSTVTPEQFEKMSIAERSNLFRENKAEYDRLVDATKKSK